MIGLVAFSFGLRTSDTEPNPCNQRLGLAVQSILTAEPTEVIIVSQWEVAKQLEAIGIKTNHVVNLRDDGEYLDTRDVWNEAKVLFDKLGIREVVPVANPYLQLFYAKKMVKDDGFQVLSKPIGRIGFDNSPQNTQAWTRNRLAFTKQVIKIVFFGGNHGHYSRQKD